MTNADTTASVESTIEILQARLETMGDLKTKAWWERYMKHVIPFRGIKMPVLRPVLFEWWDAQVAPHGLAFQKATAAGLFASRWSEDKLAGVLAFEHLAPLLEVTDLAILEGIFQQGLLFDWNNTDWLCVKVLDKLVRRGLGFAESIASWTAQREVPLWQRRAGAVAFVNIAKHGRQPPSSPDLWQMMWTAARNNVDSPERFMQTSVGWLVRELGQADADAALRFAQEHRDRLSREALRYIVEKMPPEVRQQVLSPQTSR